MDRTGEKITQYSQTYTHQFGGQDIVIEIQRRPDWPPNISITSPTPMLKLSEILTGPLPVETEMDDKQRIIFKARQSAKFKDWGNQGGAENPQYLLYIISENNTQMEPFDQKVIKPLVELGILPAKILN